MSYFCLLTHAAAVLSGIQICSWFVLLLFLSCFFRRINLESDLSNIFTSLILPSYVSILSLLSFKPCIRPLQYFTSSWYVLLLFLSCSFLRINRVSVLFSLQYFTSSWFVLLLFLSCSFLRMNHVSVLSSLQYFTSSWLGLLLFLYFFFLRINCVSASCFLLLLDSSYLCFLITHARDIVLIHISPLSCLHL